MMQALISVKFYLMMVKILILDEATRKKKLDLISEKLKLD